MKRFFATLILFLGILSSGNAQDQTLFLDKDFKTVVQQSKLENKPIVLLFYAKWCAHCNKMKKEVFTDNDVINFYKSAYICVSVDAETTEGIALKTKFQDVFTFKSYPTFVFLDPNENLLYVTTGELSKEKFINEGKNVLLPENQFSNIMNTFNKDVSNAENCLKYITILKKAGYDPTPVTQQYLATKSEKEVFSELNWRVLSNGITDIEAKEIQFIVNRKDDFAKVVSPKRIEKKLVFVASDNLKPVLENLDTINYYKKREIAAAFHINKVDSLLFRYDLILAQHTENWKKHQEIAEKSIPVFSMNDQKVLVDVSTVFLNNIKDKNGINAAINWTKKALKLGESIDKYKLLSRLYLKQKDFKNAVLEAEKAKAIATSSGWKTDEIDALLSEIKKSKK